MHSAGWEITDREMAYAAPAKLLAMSAVDLLFGGAEKAKAILVDHRPAMTVEAYVRFQEKVFRTEVYDGESGSSQIHGAG